MNNEGNIGVYETICMIILIIISKILYSSTSIIVQAVGTAGWYMTLISCITTIIAFLILCRLMDRFPGMNIIEIYDEVFGKLLGKLISFIIVSYIVYYCAINLREFLEMIRTYTLPFTPLSVILIPFMIVISIIALNGLEGLARLSFISFFAVIFGIIILLLLAIRKYNFNYIFPIYGYGIKETLKYGIMRSSAYAEVFILSIIVNSIHGNKIMKKAGLISLGLAGIIISICNLCYIATFQYTVGSENLSGIFGLSRIIYINRFIQRVEAIFIFTWVISSLITVAVSFYISISAYCKIFKISDHKPLILPFALITCTISLLPQNISEVVYIHLVVVREYSFILVFGIPLIAIIVALIFGKKGSEQKNAKV